MITKIDILAIGAHPDDIELGCGGTILNEVHRGKKVGLIDLTAGELGTRGSVEKRKQESSKASKILGVDFRLNLGMKDGFIKNDEKSQIEKSISEIENKFSKRVVTYLREFEVFYKAEDKHQDYYQEYLLNYLMYKKGCGREEVLERIWKL